MSTPGRSQGEVRRAQAEGSGVDRDDLARRATFEGSYLGDRSRLPDEARMECKICWYVYDPAEGDAQWQVPPGTPFSALPAHWTCPQCEGAATQFMVLAGARP